MMEAALGVPVVQHDDGSRSSMYDLAVLYADAQPGAAEVVAAADGESIALWNLINPGGRWIVPGLAGGWSVHVEMSARGRRIRRELPALLSVLESNGIASLDTSRGDGPFHALARDLKVARARRGDTDYPGSVYPNIAYPFDRLAGFSDDDGQGFVDWLVKFLWSEANADVRGKLTSSGALLRHAFVFVADFATPFAVTDHLFRGDATIPRSRPTLPDAITDAWVASSWASGNGFHWSDATGWTTFAKDI
jgi:hypothetical protein